MSAKSQFRTTVSAELVGMGFGLNTMSEPTRKVIKLDQIFDGTNKQDGLTILALIEAALVYLKQEFPFASIKYIQSDNAAAYHLKELVHTWYSPAQRGKNCHDILICCTRVL
jgi:hypothetical protein